MMYCRVFRACSSVRFLLQVFIQKPLGIRFGRGRDAGAYVTRVDKTAGNIDERIEVRGTIAHHTLSCFDDHHSYASALPCTAVKLLRQSQGVASWNVA